MAPVVGTDQSFRHAHELETADQPPHHFLITVAENGHGYDEIDDDVRWQQARPFLPAASFRQHFIHRADRFGALQPIPHRAILPARWRLKILSPLSSGLIRGFGEGVY